MFCLLEPPESHRASGFGRAGSARPHAHSKRLPASGPALRAEARTLYSGLPSSSVGGFRPARTRGVAVLAPETTAESRGVFFGSGLFLPGFDVGKPSPGLSATVRGIQRPPSRGPAGAKARFLQRVVPSREGPGTQASPHKCRRRASPVRLDRVREVPLHGAVSLAQGFRGIVSRALTHTRRKCIHPPEE